MNYLNTFTLAYLLFFMSGINPLSSQKVCSVPIKAEGDKTMVSVRMGNFFIPDILLDTGFSFDGIIIYNPAYLDSLDLANAISVNLGGAGSKNSQNALMLDSASFNLGEKTLTGQRIIVLQSDIYKGFPTNGIIGYSLFGHYVVEIDYDKRILSLNEYDTFKPDPGFTAIPVYFKGNMIPWIDLELIIKDEEPVKVSAYIDFADRDPVVLLERPIMKFSLPEGSEKKLLGTGLNGDVYGMTGNISKLIIGPYQMNNVQVSIAEAAVRSKQKDADIILGCGTLNRFNLIFDYRNRYLYLKPNDTFNRNR